MDRSKILQLLKVLNSNLTVDCEGDLNVLCAINISEVYKQLDVNGDYYTKVMGDINAFGEGDSNPIWQTIELNYYLATLLGDNLKDTPISDVLSVEQGKILKSAIKNVIHFGICCNLLKGMPSYRKLAGVQHEDTVLKRYSKLAGSTDCLINLLKYRKLKSVVLCDGLRPILSALYQLVYCPLKKPSGSPIETDFYMTKDIYSILSRQRDIFMNHLTFLSAYVHDYIFVRETMMLTDTSSPVWLKKAVSHNLNSVLKGKKGVEIIGIAMFDLPSHDSFDTAKMWKALDVFSTLIVSLRNAKDFEANICKQLTDLLTLNARDETTKVFESAYVACVKKLYVLDPRLCECVLIQVMTKPLIHFTDHNFINDENLMVRTCQSITMLHSCVIGNGQDDSNLPVELLTPVINVIFQLYLATPASSHIALRSESQAILCKYLECNSAIFVALDTFLFDIPHPAMKNMRNDILLIVNDGSLIVKISTDHNFKTNVTKAGEALMKLCKNSTKLQISLFVYLLNCLVEPEKYFNVNSNKDLLNIESEFVVQDAIERNLIVYQMLSTLAEDKEIQSHISKEPTEIIKYILNFLSNTIQTGVHKTLDCESECFRSLFTTVMILQALVMNTPKGNVQNYRELLQTLLLLRDETNNLEFKTLLNTIIAVVNGTESGNKHEESSKTELEAAIDDVCDPLLPIRGHGLMTLTKLLEKKDQMAMERKQYIMNIFQQNLKHDDSFIYLSAIGGLAAMGDIFPESVLSTLTDEYSDFGTKTTDDRNDIRMKVGEILVRVTKGLGHFVKLCKHKCMVKLQEELDRFSISNGQMAPKYKTILINTFLVGVKDDDYLIRASSLSNLGEICRVLGYKLGSIVTEILVCVHGVITTDKAVEVRRAAVTVIRQLLAGLETEMIAFLKDDILEIYRTLKNIHSNDRDDVMRLQAQLALEELNANMQNFVFPNPQLHMEKKIVILN